MRAWIERVRGVRAPQARAGGGEAAAQRGAPPSAGQRSTRGFAARRGERSSPQAARPATADVRRRWALGGLTVTLALLAAWTLLHWPERGLWYDETVNAYFAERPLREIWQWCTRIDNQMPLDFVLRNFWARLTGTSEFALRAFSALSVLLATAGVTGLARRLGRSAWVGAVAGAAFALSQSALYAAFEVRAYALLLALYAWASVALWALWSRCAEAERPRCRWRLFAYLVLALALLYTHYTAVLALGAHGLFIALDTLRRRSRRALSLLVQIGGALGLGYTPWWIALAGRDVRGGTAFLGRVPPNVALHAYVEFYAHGQRTLTPQTPPYAWALAGAVLLATALALFWGRRREALFALALTAVPLLGLLAMVYGVQAKLSGRHGWPMWVGAAVLLGLGAGALRRPRGARWLAGALILVLVWLPARVDLQPTYNSYLREAFAYVQEHAEPGDVLVLRDGTLFTAAGYYRAALPWIGLPPDKLTNVHRFLYLDEAVNALEQLIAEHNARRVWVIAWQGHIMDPQNLVAGVLEGIGEPQPLPDAYGFGDVTVSLYTLHDSPRAFRERVSALTPIVVASFNGPIYLGGYVLNDAPVSRGGWVVGHTWWLRGAAIIPDLRISVRLYGPNGTFYAQHDRPVVWMGFDQEHWPPGVPILSRFALQVPEDMPPGPAEVKIIIYQMQGLFSPITAPVAPFTVGE